MHRLEKNIRSVSIVGVGLLGGSIGLSLRAGDFDGLITGIGRRQSSLDEALQVGAVDAVTFDPAEGVADADMVVLSTPVGAFERILKIIKPALKPGCVVTDVGSTKRQVVQAGERTLGRGGPFVGSHPMAGTENKGPMFSRADLFAGATCIVTPTAHTPAKHVAAVETLWQVLGMRILRMTPADHDKAVAQVSHLPQLLASLLVRLPKDADLEVAASGFRDATRMASSDPEMWRDILMTNRATIGRTIAAFRKDLDKLAALIDAGDADAIEKFFLIAKKRRDTTIGQLFTDRRVAAE
jgi:prephenate dehydrogenase